MLSKPLLPLLLTFLAWPTLAASPMATVNPQSAWLVGPANIKTVANAAAAPGCSMMAEFENGRVIGFHARQNGLIGMTFDTRLNALVKGGIYNVTLTLDGGDVTLNGQANDANTISLDLRALGPDRLGTKLSQSGVLPIRFANEKMATAYATKGLNDGLARLQTCLDDELANDAPTLVRPTTMPVLAENFDDVTLPKATGNRAVKKDMVESYPIPPIPMDMLDAEDTKDMAPPAPEKADAKDNADTDQHTTGTLVDALTDLLPPGTKFSITGVDPMQQLSWSKTNPKDWRDDLSAALQNAQMNMTEKDGKVFILSSGKPQTPVAPVTSAEPVKAATTTPKIPEPSVATAPQSTMGKPVWSAKKGERLVDVLSRWAKQDGLKAQLDVPAKFTLSDDVSVTGPLNVAVAAVLEPFKGQNGAPQATFLNTPYASQNAAALPAAPVVPAAPNQPKYRGASGAPLRDVLTAWGNQAGIDVVWDADVLFDLRDPVRSDAPFENVIKQVMAQYEQDAIRPHATLNTDPTTGKQTLVIQSTGS